MLLLPISLWQPMPDRSKLALSRTDRICKYNQLLRIEEQLGDSAVYGVTLSPTFTQRVDSLSRS